MNIRKLHTMEEKSYNFDLNYEESLDQARDIVMEQLKVLLSY